MESKPSDLEAEVFHGIQTFRFGSGSISWNPNLQIWKYFMESKPSDLEVISWNPNRKTLEVEVFLGIQTVRLWKFIVPKRGEGMPSLTLCVIQTTRWRGNEKLV